MCSPGEYELRLKYLVDSLDRNEKGLRGVVWLENRDGGRSSVYSTTLRRNRTENFTRRFTVDTTHRRLHLDFLDFREKPLRPSVTVTGLEIDYIPTTSVAVDSLYRQQLDLRIFADEFLRAAIQAVASNLLWTPQGLLRNPLVGVAADGRILSRRDVSRARPVSRHRVLCRGARSGAGQCPLPPRTLLFAGGDPRTVWFCGVCRCYVAGAGTLLRRTASTSRRCRHVAGGIEAVGDISNGDTTFAVKSRSRIAYRTFVEFFGLRAASAEHLLPLLRHPQTSLTPIRSIRCRMPPCVRSLPGAMPRFRSISWNLPAKRRSSNTAARCGSGTRRPVSPAISCITAPRPNASWPACRATAA